MPERTNLNQGRCERSLNLLAGHRALEDQRVDSYYLQVRLVAIHHTGAIPNRAESEAGPGAVFSSFVLSGV